MNLMKRSRLGIRTALCLTTMLAGAQAQDSHPAGTVIAWGYNSGGQTNVPANLSQVIAIAGGGQHSLALKSDGTVVAWGANSAGQTNVPVGLGGVAALAGGPACSLALKSNGTVVAWGSSEWGHTNVPADLTDVIAIAAGYWHCLALKSNGTVVAWGKDYTNVPAGLGEVIAVAAGGAGSAGGGYSLALKSDGTVFAWGDNHYGQTNVPPGLSGVIAIAGGGALHCMALKSDGTVVAWGGNPHGQTSVPAGLQGVIAVAEGFVSSMALKSNGTVVAWGDNSVGQTNIPAGLNGVRAIAGGWHHSLALVADPRLQIPPASQTAEEGSTVEFSVNAAGSPAFVYQWFFDGTNSLSCTNPVLQLDEVQFAQAGAYTVVVTNMWGAVTSAPAMLNVIPPVERRTVPALTLMGSPGSALNLDFASAVGPASDWTTFDHVLLAQSSQMYFDLAAPLLPQKFYRTWQTGAPIVTPALDIQMIPALTLRGDIGTAIRVEAIKVYGPTDAWFTLDTVTLTNTSQLFFDVTAPGQPWRLYRLVPVP